MTVKELKEALQNCDENEEVAFNMLEGCCGDFRELTICNHDILDGTSTKDTKAGITRKFIRIDFYPVPGYYSCIQVGKTLRDNKEYWDEFGEPSIARAEREIKEKDGK